MKRIRIVLPVVVAALGFLVTTFNVTATPEMARKEKTACKSCHEGAKLTKAHPGLNKTGDCYKESKDLKECKK